MGPSTIVLFGRSQERAGRGRVSSWRLRQSNWMAPPMPISCVGGWISTDLMPVERGRERDERGKV